MAHAPFQYRRNREIDLFSISGRRLLWSGVPSNLDRLAVQLTLDASVLSLKFVTSLPLAGEEVAVGMLVAERAHGSIAYDIVDERAHRDIDSEGLLLIALDHHGIARLEIDARSIGAEPRAGNADRIWKHRDLEVRPGVLARIEQALKTRSLPVRDLGRAVKLRNSMAIVCALMCRRVLYTELSSEFGFASRVALRTRSPADKSLARKTADGAAR